MYVRKHSLLHRPNCWMSHRGNPAAAAVVAAPILSECDDTGDPGSEEMASLKMEFRRRRVSSEPSVNVKSGPVLCWCMLMCAIRFLTGQMSALEGDRRMVHPSLKGWVFEALIRR